ncbi:hypothetical protein EVAR_93101_1 [Eumeta japonica]|uniref:Uncharacterized protein n=1 Tax=Eumeta variegata TaxID=151549 RepID=A0A4C1TFZ9_EUMVA|nr:hypothetical protein EVAR_93101_1 [Eumeta japonica]
MLLRAIQIRYHFDIVFSVSIIRKQWMHKHVQPSDAEVSEFRRYLPNSARALAGCMRPRRCTLGHVQIRNSQ